MRAVATDLTGGQVQGGSTLAQQYVKNALLLTAADSAEQRAAVADSAARKIRELRIAISVERKLTPDQLLGGISERRVLRELGLRCRRSCRALFPHDSRAPQPHPRRLRWPALYRTRPSSTRWTTRARPRRAGTWCSPAWRNCTTSPAPQRPRLRSAARRPLLRGVSSAGLLERLGRERRLVLRLRASRAADQSRLRVGLAGDEHHRRPPGLHDHEPGGPASRAARGELHAPGPAVGLQLRW